MFKIRFKTNKSEYEHLKYEGLSCVKHYLNDTFYHQRDWYNEKKKLFRREWYKNDRLHKEDGPAIEYIEGVKQNYFADGSKNSFWLNGLNITYSEWSLICKRSNKEWWLEDV